MMPQPQVGSPRESMSSKHHRRASGKGQEVGGKRQAKHPVKWLAFLMFAGIILSGEPLEHALHLRLEKHSVALDLSNSPIRAAGWDLELGSDGGAFASLLCSFLPLLASKLAKVVLFQVEDTQ
jgi:hypothetical protein